MRAYDLQEGIILTENESDTIEMEEFRISVFRFGNGCYFNRKGFSQHDISKSLFRPLTLPVLGPT